MDNETCLTEETPIMSCINRQKMEVSELRGIIRKLRSRLQPILQEEICDGDNMKGVETEPIKLGEMIDRNTYQINRAFGNLQQIIKELTI